MEPMSDSLRKMIDEIELSREAKKESNGNKRITVQYPQEMQLYAMRSFIRGASNQQIANALKIRESTTRTWITRKIPLHYKKAVQEIYKKCQTDEERESFMKFVLDTDPWEKEEFGWIEPWTFLIVSLEIEEKPLHFTD